MDIGQRKLIKRLLVWFVVFISLFFAASFSVSATHLGRGRTVQFNANVTSPFGYRIHPVTGEYKIHTGVDLAGNESGDIKGTEIPALFAGQVVYGQTGIGIDPGGFGNMIAVVNADHTIGYVYGHVQDIYVSPGEWVQAGEPIATVGDAGLGTGAHLHLGVFPGEPYNETSEALDPTSYIQSSSFFHIGGDISNNTFGSLGDAVMSLIPHWNMDFASYFEPSQEAEKMAKEIINRIVLAFDMGSKYLFPMLVTIAICDFSWFMLTLALGFRNDLGLSAIIVRLLRYSFYFMIFKSWHWLIENFCIPLVENISSVFSGTPIQESSFLKFDELFVSVTHVVGSYLHVDDRFGLFAGAAVSCLVIFILVLTMVATFYLMYKLILFYIMCVFGVLGIPCLFFSKIKPYGKNMISVIFGSAFDLIFTAFLYVFIADQLSVMQPLEPDSISVLTAFALSLLMLVMFLPKFSESALQAFASLWD